MQNIFSSGLVSVFLLLKPDFRNSSSSFVRLNWGIVADKLAINWKIFDQVGFQLKLAFRIRALILLKTLLN